MDLSALGLDGAVQVHVAPTLLTIDERAHQVFVGFSAADVFRAVRFRFRGPAMVGTVGDMREIALEELSSVSGGLVVVRSEGALHPGAVAGLVWVVDRLLGPGGCPWDQEQTHESLKRHLIEECYELLQAIDSGDDAAMKEELGDLLLQPIMHAQMESLAGNWDIDGVARLVTDKLIRRHPHVFGSVAVSSSDDVLRNWDEIKKAEKGGDDSVLAGVPITMPALLRAFEVSKRAARSGFEWPDVDGVWAKFREEEAELRTAVSSGDKAGIASEMGDLLFTVVNLARWVGVEPEEALRQMVDRFTNRFQSMERMAGRPLSELSAEEWDALWGEAKSHA